MEYSTSKSLLSNRKIKALCENLVEGVENELGARTALRLIERKGKPINTKREIAEIVGIHPKALSTQIKHSLKNGGDTK